ncbi:hypothetical protein PLICRDRAFT_43127 [Plicaturopsis crispa FD-325 SS-3]|nr:hypothetical protein PLICRDRAFT_43127 [Plicaturopsis crispa FD-325 SS-3]
MSSFDKVVRLACKPKAAPPKAKYLDPIIAATWSEDGAVHDVCKALSPRFREPNAIVVFKALIVLHHMIRNGATDNVLSYLSSSEVLRLRNVSAGNWEGYNTPQNLQHYAIYLDSRIRAYRDLKHDVVRVQAESNRDMRNSTAMEETGYSTRTRGGGGGGGSSSNGPTRSKTISGRKLRVMTVEKGLLRETKAVQRTIDALVECRFYLDDLEDELTITALRMLVKDLLILFQAGNEGVINVLEHYFEMSHVDASSALALYRHFCKQTEEVVEYLMVAKKLQNLLNVPIPNLKHAPVSLAGALQEYLNDPNFEQNRIEYKANKAAVEKSERSGSKPDASTAKKAETPSSPKPSTPAAQPAASTSSAPAKAETNQNMVDFFSAIEEEQPTMFNPQTGSPTATYFQQQAAHNPFVQRQMTGAQPFMMPQMQPQQTGFMMPQQTAFQPPPQQQQQQQQQQPPNPFGLQPPQQQQQSQPQHRPFSSFLQPQNTGFMQPQSTGFMQPQSTGFMQQQPTGLLQPQATGSNPFRQSTLFPQSTGMAAFSPGGQQNGGSTPFSGQNQGQPFGQSSATPFAGNSGPFGRPLSTVADLPPRPASTPLKSSSSPPPMQPVKSHQTGSRNPFGVPVTPAPPMPKPPTLFEQLSMGGNSYGMNGSQNSSGGNQPQAQPQQPQQTGGFGGLSAFGSFNAGGGDMASVASEFLKQDNKPNGATPSSPPSFLSSQHTATTTNGSTFSDSVFSSLSTQPTGATSASGTSSAGAPGISVSAPLQPHQTGYGGVKAFTPSSSFGASLLESLPPIPGSSPNTPAVTGNGAPSGVAPQQTGFGQFNAQPTGVLSPGSGLGSGLRPQMTGGGANPFRVSMMANTPTGGAFGGPSSQFSPGSTGNQFNPTSAFGQSFSPPPTNNSPFGANAFGGQGAGAFGTFNPGQNGPSPSQQQQQQTSGSLI